MNIRINSYGQIHQKSQSQKSQSFGSFSPMVKEILSREQMMKLSKQGVGYFDLSYLSSHKLNIAVGKSASDNIYGLGLIIKPPKSMADAPHIDLTPITEAEPRSVFYKFKPIEETLVESFKKALNFFKKFDKIAEGAEEDLMANKKSLTGLIEQRNALQSRTPLDKNALLEINNKIRSTEVSLNPTKASFKLLDDQKELFLHE